MSKQSLLLVDGDTRSLRVLEVSLRKAGFTVTPAASVQDALDKLELHAPDLIISETTFPDGDGFELRRRVRATPDWAEIPFIFLTAEAAIENKIRGLELGVDDYLTKPIYIKEIVTRINILLQKRQRVRFEERKDGRTRFAGRVSDMPVVDVIQTIEISRKSGVIQFVGERGRQAAIYFRDGRVIDAEAGTLQAEDAVYRLLTWSEGEFEVVFRTVRRREVIQTSSQGLLMEGMRRLDEWSRLLEQLPPLTHRFEIDTIELAGRLGDVPDDNNTILRLIDGKRTLLEVIDGSDLGDLECLQAISRLFFEELLIDLDQNAPPKRDTGRPMPLVEVSDSGSMLAADARVADELGVRDSQVIDEQAVEAAVPQTSDSDAPSHALMGQYRPSSLRLIDDAIAAAQAIDPSLFEDETPSGVPLPATDESSIPQEIAPESEQDGMPGVRAARAARAKASSGPPAPVSRPVRSEESGLRMIGSLGRDRAEASGELVPFGSTPFPTSETQRELVTIMPRRNTREVPIVPPAPAVEPAIPRTITPPRTGSGVAVSNGPSSGAKLILGLAVLLAGVATFVWLRKDEPVTVPADAAVVVIADAPVLVDAAPVIVDAAPVIVDAAPMIVDAAPVIVDAAVRKAIPVDANPVTSPELAAKGFRDLAFEAMQEGDFEKALSQADQAIKLHRSARAFIVRGLALHRLGRVDDALASMDSAIELAPTYGGSFEGKGSILWAAGRYDEATVLYQKYLQVAPTGDKVEMVKKRLAEQH